MAFKALPAGVLARMDIRLGADRGLKRDRKADVDLHRLSVPVAVEGQRRADRCDPASRDEGPDCRKGFAHPQRRSHPNPCLRCV